MVDTGGFAVSCGYCGFWWLVMTTGGCLPITTSVVETQPALLNLIVCISLRGGCCWVPLDRCC